MTQTDNLFYDEARFKDLAEKYLVKNDISQRKTLKVNKFGVIYFEKSDVYSLSPKDRDQFLEQNQGKYDYHYDVIN